MATVTDTMEFITALYTIVSDTDALAYNHPGSTYAPGFNQTVGTSESGRMFFYYSASMCDWIGDTAAAATIREQGYQDRLFTDTQKDRGFTITVGQTITWTETKTWSQIGKTTFEIEEGASIQEVIDTIGLVSSTGIAEQSHTGDGTRIYAESFTYERADYDWVHTYACTDITTTEYAPMSTMLPGPEKYSKGWISIVGNWEKDLTTDPNHWQGVDTEYDTLMADDKRWNAAVAHEEVFADHGAKPSFENYYSEDSPIAYKTADGDESLWGESVEVSTPNSQHSAMHYQWGLPLSRIYQSVLDELGATQVEDLLDLSIEEVDAAIEGLTDMFHPFLNFSSSFDSHLERLTESIYGTITVDRTAFSRTPPRALKKNSLNDFAGDEASFNPSLTYTTGSMGQAY